MVDGTQVGKDDPMSTRALILAALLCGLAILVAGTLALVRF